MADSKLEQKLSFHPEAYSASNEVKEITENNSEQPSESFDVKKITDYKHPFKKHSKIKRPSVALPQTRDELTIKVEKILEENIGEAYSRLPPIARQEFKLKGEITAQKISELLQSTHVKVKKVFQLILEWLKMLPGINKFFLEQEAKIKADRIIALHQRRSE